MKKLFLIALLLAAPVIGVWQFSAPGAEPQYEFRTARVERGELVRTIRATGTTEPEELIDVGAQIIGQVKRLGADAQNQARMVDYGSRVSQGMVLVEIDDGVFKAKVEQARATLARIDAEVREAEARRKYAEQHRERLQKLKGTVTESDHERAELELDVAQALLQEAETNLQYTVVRSPVDGIVIDRRVNVGQTVVSSLNAPSLFLIAKDLSRMQIWASVNEADVGGIHPGQAVRFTVSAYPEQVRRGTVQLVRLNARVTENIVTYTVVVGVDNEDGKLLPYMTADLQFELERRDDCLRAATRAVRWSPDLEMLEPELRDEWEPRLRALSAETSEAAASGTKPAWLWRRSGEFVVPVSVETGLSDSAWTQIQSGDAIEGAEVIVGHQAPAARVSRRTPFLPQFKRGGKKT